MSFPPLEGLGRDVLRRHRHGQRSSGRLLRSRADHAPSRWAPSRWRLHLAVAAVAMLVLGSCSSDDGDDGATDRPAGSETADADTDEAGDTRDRPDGPAATVEQELTGGDGLFMATGDAGLSDAYVEEEYLAEGTATSYQVVGEQTDDGRWTFEPSDEADYTTRIVVRRPADAADSSGTVLVEWLNVSGGVDADAGYSTLREEVLRAGHTWVGVSAQLIGVEGGDVAVEVDVAGAEAQGMGLKALDPERYGDLSHPGDGYSFDIFTQVARALRAGSPAFGDVEPERLVAVGQSQSAFALVTYVNGVQPLTEAFDGFFVLSRGGASLSLAAPGEFSDISSSIGGTPTILRTDTDVPIFEVQAENDVVGVLRSFDSRQPDTDLFRIWEVAGTSHADAHILGDDRADTIDCGVPINDGPLHVVSKAALRHLAIWLVDGTEPPTMPLIELNDEATAVVRDEDGLALGGVRTPPVDVPTRALSGEAGPNTEIICILLGSGPDIPADRLTQLHGSRADFEVAYDAAIGAAIDAGVVVEDDREAIAGYAHPELVPE